MTASHAAIVLAAGGSRRLGRPKQLLRRADETLLHRAARLASGTNPQRLLVVLGAHRDACELALADIACEIVINEDWQSGMASSLRAAAAALVGHRAPTLILACDQSALEITHLQQLLTGAASASSGCAATSHADKRGVPAVVTPSLLAEAARLQADHGLGGRLRLLPDDAVWTLRAPDLEFDLDTEADVESAIARGWLDADQPS
ncbi:nucleotidyltransferase family protein [Luteimonas panaciterrae]|uniref:nucleotidyltransferase family protein n=1 Tax=Luteimonas panaciterrae TaxID=363885 RepID=UPI001CF9971A|nr:nucleotidyltransferase family protein [Luteimonas panaciterrae]